jgi:phosphoketolase
MASKASGQARPLSQDELRRLVPDLKVRVIFDMTVCNDLDRFHLVSNVIDRVSKLGAIVAHAQQSIRDQLIEHALHIAEQGEKRPAYETGCGAIK